MIAIPTGARVYLAMGPTDMRKGFDGLSMLAQSVSVPSELRPLKLAAAYPVG